MKESYEEMLKVKRRVIQVHGQDDVQSKRAALLLFSYQLIRIGRLVVLKSKQGNKYPAFRGFRHTLRLGQRERRTYWRRGYEKEKERRKRKKNDGKTCFSR
ncbi:hypothetical protein AWENTII_004661 [Aspergillus wentii]